MEVLRIDSNNFTNISRQRSNKKSDTNSTFANLLATKKENIVQDLEDMNRARIEIKINQTLHEILTGKPVDEPIEDKPALIIDTTIDTNIDTSIEN